MRGDGIGHEVVGQGLKVLDAVLPGCETTEFDLGAARYHRTGEVLPDPVLAARLRDRRGDASDADVSVLARQRAHPTGAIGWSRIDASGATAAIVEAAGRVIGLPA